MLIKPTFEEAVNLGLSIPNLNDVSCVVLDSSKNQRDVTLKTLPGGMLGMSKVSFAIEIYVFVYFVRFGRYICCKFCHFISKEP